MLMSVRYLSSYKTFIFKIINKNSLFYILYIALTNNVFNTLESRKDT